MTPFPDQNAARLIYDPVLGWRRRPGVSFERMKSLSRKLVIGENGYRVLPGQPEEFDKRVWIFGCSCTEGQWLSDEDTFCFRLQQRFPNWKIEPFAVGGYSTFQNLLQLEANLVTAKPDVVIFTYIPGHLLRNVADPFLFAPVIEGNAERFNHGLGRGMATFRPAARINRQGTLIMKQAYPPENREVYEGMMGNRPDSFYMDIVMAKILRRARDLTEEAGAAFYFTVLWSDESARSNGCGSSDHLQNDPLMNRLRNAGLEIIDADPRIPFEEGTFHPLDTHPNAVANEHYAQSIGDALESAA